MAGADLHKVVKLFCAANNIGNPATLRDDCINLNELQLSVKDGIIDWTLVNRPENRSPANINVKVVKTQDGAYADAVPEMQVKKVNETFGNVTLETGIVKGLNKLLTLPLTSQTALRNYIGECVKINLGKEKTELTKDKSTVAVSLAVEGGGFSTTTETKKVDVKARFRCAVAISGPVIVNANGSVFTQTIQDVVRELQPRPEVNIFTVCRNDVTFSLNGTLDFLWDCEQRFEWDDVRS